MKKYQEILDVNTIQLASISHHAIHYEALSRGLTVSILNKNNLKYSKYFLKSDRVGRVFKISNGLNDYLFNTSKVIFDNNNYSLTKSNIKNILKNNEFNYINSMVFKKDSLIDFDLIEENLRKPYVVKPLNGSMGENVFCDLKSKSDVMESISQQVDDFIIEEYIDHADEYRVYVVNSKISALCKRIAPFVIGDGVNNIDNLVNIKNKIRASNKLSKILASSDIDLEKIPKLNEKVIVSNVKGRSRGADIEVVNAGLELGIVKEIERFSKLFPNCITLGFDILVKAGQLFILEINSRPQLSSALFPDHGEPVDIPSDILDSLFGRRSKQNIDFKEFISSYNNINKKIGIDWESINYQYKDGKLTTYICL